MFEELLEFDCDCGKHHSMTTRDFIVEKDAMHKISELLEKLNLDKKPLAVFDKNTYVAAYPKFSKNSGDIETLIIEGDEIHPDEHAIDQVTRAISDHGVVLAVGSGVINDVVRYAAFQKGIPFISVPTAASVDGYVSNGAVVTLKGAKATIPTKAPVAVVADLEIIADAPKKLTAAGVGDMLSKYISIADWRIGHLITDEYYCDKVAQLELEALDIIKDNIDGIADGDIDAIGKLVEGLLISGIAIQLVGITRPASSFEHHFSHYLEIVQDEPNIDYSALHGEKVAIASVAAVDLYPKFAKESKRIFEENLPNNYSEQRVLEEYNSSPKSVKEALLKENDPTISLKLNVDMLKDNYDKVLECAENLPTGEELKEILNKVGGYTTYKDIGMTEEQYKKIFEICCYIRNRFTLLRLMRDYDLFDFDTIPA